MPSSERDWTFLQVLDIPIFGKAIMILFLLPIMFLADCMGIIDMGIKNPPKKVVEEHKEEPKPPLKERAQDGVADFIKGVQRRLKE